MTLRPGGGPARLLLELWQAQADGFRCTWLPSCRSRARLLQEKFITADGHDALHIYALTQAGRAAAQTLDAGSR